MCNVCVLLLSLFVAESIWTWPHYLSYFSPLFGGGRNGYPHLVDSSLDWGQDLPSLKRRPESSYNESSDATIYLSYFGSDDPAYYPIKANLLPSYIDWHPPEVFPLAGGTYCISATQLQAVYTEPHGRWTVSHERNYQSLLSQIAKFDHAPIDVRNKLLLDDKWNSLLLSFNEYRLARLLAFLRQRQPNDHVGHSLLIYRLTERDAQEAVVGPPAELLPDDEKQ